MRAVGVEPVLAVVTDAVAPWHRGGKESRTRHYASELAAQGFNVHVFTMRWWREPAIIREGAVSMHGICRPWSLYHGQRRSIWQAVAFSSACSRLLWARFDVAEVDQIPIAPLIVMRGVCTLRRKPMIATWHEVWGTDYWRQYLGPLGRLAAVVERLALRLPDCVITPSEGTADRVRAVNGGRPVFVGPNGIDVNEIASTPPAPTPYDLIYVGRLLEHKGVDVLLEAVAQIAAESMPLTVAIVGEGPASESLHRQAETLGLQGHVAFLGALPRNDDVFAQMKSSRLFVFPSQREGFGVAAIEAMACGLPVITSNHEDNFTRQLVTPGENGYLCGTGRGDLAGLILRALSERDALSAGAVRTARTYTWAAGVQQCMAAYNRPRTKTAHSSRPWRRQRGVGPLHMPQG